MSLIRYIESLGGDPKADRKRPMIWESKFGNVDIIQFLESLGASSIARNNTPIIMAT